MALKDTCQKIITNLFSLGSGNNNLFPWKKFLLNTELGKILHMADHYISQPMQRVFTAVELVYHPFSQLASQEQIYYHLQLSLQCDPIAICVPNLT